MMDACDRAVPSVEDIIPSVEDVVSLSTAYPYGFELVDRNEAALSDADLARVRNWLSPTDYLADNSEFNRHLASHAPGTGVWLSELDSYREWHNSASRGSLWIKGVPGAGKSVVAAAMIDHFIKTEPEAPVLFFFFRQIIHANRRRRSMLCDWLAQLLPHSTTLQATLLPLIGSSQEELPDQVLWECLLKGLSSMDRVYCVVDALDESDGTADDTFLHRLNELATFRPACVKLLMTSRPRQDLQSVLRAESIVHISLEEARVNRDIHSFVLHKLTQEVPDLDPPERTTLAQSIGKRSAGLFLYARLLVDQVIPGLQQGHNLNVDRLPVGLEEMYSSVLGRQSAQLDVATGVQVFILGCITQCLRPLRLLEMASLLSIHLQSDMTPAQAKVLVKQACGPLLEVQDDETVQVIHHSFTEFLLDPQQRTPTRERSSQPQFPLIDAKLLHKQLAILCMNLLREQWVQPYERYRSKQTPNPFLAYAEQFWTQHLQYDSQTNDPELFDAMKSLCGRQLGLFHDWASRITRPFGGFQVSEGPCLSSLHLAAHCGLMNFARTLIEDGLVACFDDVIHHPVKGGINSTRPSAHPWPCLPLWWACRQGHLQMVEYLLPKTLPLPAMGDSDRYYDPNLVEVTASHGHANVLEFLLKAGFGPLGFISDDRKNLGKVVRNYTPACLAVTLPYLEEDVLTSLLCLYAKKGGAEAVKSIVNSPKVSVDNKFEGRTPLYYACWAHDVDRQRDAEDSSYNILLNNGSVECVKLLLKAGASVSALSDPPLREESPYSSIPTLYVESRRTPLHGLVSAWNDDTHEICCKIFQLLIRSGAELEARDGVGDTPLLALFPQAHAQARVGRALEYLLKNGADPSVYDKDGLSVLHRALEYHREMSIIQPLVKYGADVNALASVRDRGQDRQDVSPLEMLFDDPQTYHFAKPNGKRPDKQPSSKARDYVSENQAIARFLVDHGANIDAGGLDRGLLKALSVCDAETLKILLKSRKNSQTLQKVLFSFNGVYAASLEDRPLSEMVASLIAAGASLEETDHRGRTPLLCSVDEPILFETLLKAGANRFAVDSEGNGVLHVLVARRHIYQAEAVSVEKLRFFVELGFDPRGLNNNGDSLLHLAITATEPLSFRSNKESPMLPPLLEQLIRYGLSPRSKNAQGMTPLHVFMSNMTDCLYPSLPEAKASSPKSINQIIEILKTSSDGFDINSQDMDGLTPLHIAAMSSSPNASMALEVLVGHGADITALTNSGRTALHLACTARNTSVIPFFLDRTGPDLIHVKDSRGRTALFDACVSGVLESVALLLDHGAEIFLEDHEGKRPLHLCAEFPIEQARWNLVQFIEHPKGVISQPPTDRFRPYKATVADYPMEKRPWQKGREKRGRLFSGDGSAEQCFNLPFLGNENAAIYSVVKKVLQAGGENTASQKFKLTPAEYAAYNHCEGMMTAMEELSQTELEIDLVAQLALTKLGRTSPQNLSGKVKGEIIQHPTRYISHFDNDSSMDWLRSEGANFFTTFSVPEKQPKNRLFDNREHAVPEMSFMHNIVMLGLTTFMEKLGELARHFDSPTNMIDGWSVTTSAMFESEWLRANDSWDLDKLAKTCTLKIRPLVYQACVRRCRNMEMIKVLVEKCGADVNAQEIRYSYSSSDRESMGALTAMAYMALRQEYWHLDAIRYLASQGADINVKDVKGQTPLIIACDPGVKQPRKWAPLFVKLLLELGADPNIQDDEGKTCIDIVKSQELLDLLIAGGGDVTSRRAQLLYNALDSSDLDLMRRALDEGAELNEANSIYSWRLHTYSLQIGTKDKYPLMGAILHTKRGYAGKRENSEDKRRRNAMVQLMLERGADTTIMLKCGQPLLHVLVNEVVCDKEILDLFLERSSPKILDMPDSSGRSVFLAACDFIDHRQPISERRHDASTLCTELLDLGADIFAMDNNKMNALHIMIDNLHMPTARILSFLTRPEARRLALAKDAWGRTPLDYAFRVFRPEVCSVLLDMGMVPNAAAFEGGLAPLHFIAAGCFEAHLMRYERNRVARQNNATSHFFAACTMPDHLTSSLRLWHRFIDTGMAVDIPDEDGEPPLFGYLRRSEPPPDHRARHINQATASVPSNEPESQPRPRQIAHFDELFGDANLKARNARGETALHVIACAPRQPNEVAVFKFLVDKGLDPLAEDNNGRSSLDMASEAKKTDILELFRKKN